MRRLALVSCLVVLGCGGSSSSSGASETTSAASRAPVGNAAVTARIASVPAPPIAWSTQFGSITAADAEAFCPWAIEHVQTTEVNEHCPDGSDVHVGAGCEVEGLVQMAGQFAQVSCSLNVAEYSACLLAIRADPCGSGAFGANAPECEAMTECLRVAFAAAAAAQSSSSGSP